MSGLHTAFLDTNVLFGALSNDIFLSLATGEKNLFRMRWSEYVYQELRDNLLENLVAPIEDESFRERRRRSLENRLHQMRMATSAYFVHDWEPLVEYMREYVSDVDDAAVVAGAIKGKADRLVTDNISDFDTEGILRKLGITTIRPGAFLSDLYHDDPSRMNDALIEMVGKYQRPPRNLKELSERLSDIPSLSRLGKEMNAEAMRRFSNRSTAGWHGTQGRDSLGRFTNVPRGDDSDLPDLVYGIWGGDGNMF